MKLGSWGKAMPPGRDLGRGQPDASVLFYEAGVQRVGADRCQWKTGRKQEEQWLTVVVDLDPAHLHNKPVTVMFLLLRPFR